MRNLGKLCKSLVLYFFPFIAILLCLFSKETSNAARNAVYLCLDVVIPSLFPFFVLSRMIVPFISGIRFPGFLKKITERFFRLPYYTLIIIFFGFISGYPNGAKMTRDMFDRGLLDSRQASRLLPVANNCSPLFIVGTVGACLFKSVKLGMLLLLIHWVSGVIAAFIIGRLAGSRVCNGNYGKIVDIMHGKNQNNSQAVKNGRKNMAPDPESLSVLIPLSVEEAALLCIKVSGYIILFAVISELLARLGIFTLIGSVAASLLASENQGLQEFIAAFSKGIIEITSGSQAVSSLKDTSLNIQLSVVSLFFGFAGFSVHTQIMGIMKGTGCKYRVLFTGKLLHGIIAGIISFLALHVMPMTVQASGADIAQGIGLSWTRPVVLLILILSLAVGPYRVSSLKKDSDKVR